MSQTTTVSDTAATANSTMTRDANGDSAARRFALAAAAGGLDNLGYERGGVLSISATTTFNPDGSPSVSGVMITVNASSGARTVNLLAAASYPGLVLEVVKTDSSTNTVTVDPNGSENIGGVTTQTLYDQYEAIRFRSDGSAWQIIAWYHPYEKLQVNIPDPGNGGAISVTRSGHVELVSAGAETRTIADPSFEGQEILLYCYTYGGSIAVTAAHAINVATNTTMTFGAAGYVIRLNAIKFGGNLRWSVVYKDGVTLS